MLFDGYLNRADATAEVFDADGWYRTGDVAVVDADGMHRIVGRESVDLIKSGGYRIGAGEIETALLGHPGVDEVAVVGVPDDDLGQRIVAFVVGDAEPEALIGYVAEQLSAHKRPREVRMVRFVAAQCDGQGAQEGADDMTLRFCEICVDAADIHALGQWWSQVLGWPSEDTEDGDVAAARTGRRRTRLAVPGGPRRQGRQEPHPLRLHARRSAGRGRPPDRPRRPARRHRPGRAVVGWCSPTPKATSSVCWLPNRRDKPPGRQQRHSADPVNSRVGGSRSRYASEHNAVEETRICGRCRRARRTGCADPQVATAATRVSAANLAGSGDAPTNTVFVSPAVSAMNLGATETPTTAPSAMATSMAVPAIKGGG